MDRLAFPPICDFGFYRRRKHDKWREVAPPDPALEAPVADSHAHLHMLPDPAWELARCAANGVDFLCMIVDPSEDGTRPFDELGDWCIDAENPRLATPEEVRGNAAWIGSDERGFACPDVRLAVGVHPHNARLYDAVVEWELIARLGHAHASVASLGDARADHASLGNARVAALGEIGLDYHYDLSPRDVQRTVFRRQIALAKKHDLPVVLHLRSGADPQTDNAHREAFEILQEEGMPERGVLLHCCALPPDELRCWIDAGCYIAYGGAITFKNADAAREGARLVPADRLLLETDAPYMAPEPMRGAACAPAHVIFTAAALADIRDIQPGEQRRAFLQQLHDNTLRFYAAHSDSGKDKA